MGDTFSAFITFISEDSIMMGLCIAILVLIIMFILVLILGKKKDVKKEIRESDTEELLKTEINMEALKSTSEYKIDELNGEKNIVIKDEKEEEKPPVSVAQNEAIVEEIPVTTEEAVKLEVEEQPKAETESVVEPQKINGEGNGSIPSFDDLKITEPTSEIPIEEGASYNDTPLVEAQDGAAIIESITNPVVEDGTKDPVIDPIVEEESLNSLNVVESLSVPIEEPGITTEDIVLEPIVEENINIENIHSAEDTPHMENNIETAEHSDVEEIREDSTVEPVNVESSAVDASVPPVVDIPENIFDFVPESIEEDHQNDLKEIDIVSEDKGTVIEMGESESSVEASLENVELPTMSEDDEDVELPDYSDIYSIDDIELPNINLDEFKTNPFGGGISRPSENKMAEDEDLDLPKLNTNANASINNLHGESFNIEK